MVLCIGGELANAVGMVCSVSSGDEAFPDVQAAHPAAARVSFFLFVLRVLAAEYLLLFFSTAVLLLRFSPRWRYSTRFQQR